MDEHFKEITEALSKDIPLTLWHYTTAAGFEAILRGQHLRATNSRFLNDRRELEHAGDLLLKELNRNAAKFIESYTEYEMNAAWSAHNATYAMAQSVTQFFGRGHAWVACFSAARDDLAQWRAYGGTGDRYCIGFDAAEVPKLKPSCRTDGDHLVGLFRVSYESKEQQRFIKKLAGFAILNMRAKRHTHEKVVAMLQNFAALMKDPAFASESEWRFVVNTTDSAEGVDVAERAGYLRPFIRLAPSGDVPLLPIRSVIVLPGADRARTIVATELLLERSGYGRHVDVTVSAVPFVSI